MRLHVLPGSPYSRIARVTAMELGLDCEVVEDEGFPPREAQSLNPAGQVPTLVDGPRTLFGTRLICDYLFEAASRSAASEPGIRQHPDDPALHWSAAQILTALDALLAAVVTRSYLIWTGVRHDPQAAIPFDMAERELARLLSLLDWLEDRCDPDGFLADGFSLHDLWLTATLDWTEARIAIPWRGRPRLEALFAATVTRPSLRATRPSVWP